MIIPMPTLLHFCRAGLFKGVKPDTGCHRGPGDKCGTVKHDRPYFAGGAESGPFVAWSFNGEPQCLRHQSFADSWFGAAAAVFRRSLSEDKQARQLANSTNEKDPYFKPFNDFATKYDLKTCAYKAYWGIRGASHLVRDNPKPKPLTKVSVPGLEEKVPYRDKGWTNSHSRGSVFVKGLQFRVLSPKVLELHQVQDTGFGKCKVKVAWDVLMCKGCSCKCKDGNEVISLITTSRRMVLSTASLL